MTAAALFLAPSASDFVMVEALHVNGGQAIRSLK